MVTEAILPPNTLDTLHLRVDSALREHPHLRGIGIQPLTDGDNVILSGTVRSYFLKQMAQEAVRGIAGADKVDNQIKVDW